MSELDSARKSRSLCKNGQRSAQAVRLLQGGRFFQAGTTWPGASRRGRARSTRACQSIDAMIAGRPAGIAALPADAPAADVGGRRNCSPAANARMRPEVGEPGTGTSSRMAALVRADRTVLVSGVRRCIPVLAGRDAIALAFVAEPIFPRFMITERETPTVGVHEFENPPGPHQPGTGSRRGGPISRSSRNTNYGSSSSSSSSRRTKNTR